MNNNENKINELCNIIMRQTNYTMDECKEKLKLHNYDIIKVINEYMGIEKKNIQKKKTTNQMIYSEFRYFLDDACNKYRIKKEYTEKLNRYREIMLKNNVVDNSNIKII